MNKKDAKKWGKLFESLAMTPKKENKQIYSEIAKRITPEALEQSRLQIDHSHKMHHVMNNFLRYESMAMAWIKFREQFKQDYQLDSVSLTKLMLDKFKIHYNNMAELYSILEAAQK